MRMKVRDLQLYLRYSLSKDILLSFVRNNFLGLVSIFVIVNVIDYYDYFEEDEMLYLVLTGVALLFSLVVFVKYRNPLSYYPRYVLFVKDRNDALVKMEPKIDPLITTLGLIKPKDFVNVRYVVYPELDLGLDFDPNTGVISGYPLELGNHTSEVKMKFLGGEYSTTVRVEVIETAVLKERVEGSPFAAPRTVAQLLLREEDLKKREQEIDYRLQTKRMDMEEEFVSKQISLEQQFEVERATFNETLEKTKEEYEKILDNKDKQLVELKKDFDRRLEQNKNEYEQELAVFESNLDESKEKIDELETLALETGSAAANIEEQYVDMMDALATESFSDKPVEEEPKEEAQESVKEEAKEEEIEEESDEEHDYVSMTKAELVELAKKRNLKFSGNKKKLIERLSKSDYSETSVL